MSSSCRHSHCRQYYHHHHFVLSLVSESIQIKIKLELLLSGLIGASNHPDKQKIRKTEFFFENRLHWQFGVRLLLFAVCITQYKSTKCAFPKLMFQFLFL